MATKKKTYRAVVGIDLADGTHADPGDAVIPDKDDIKWLLECGAIEEADS